MSTLLLLARHGETIDNARQIMQGQTQGQLNEGGIAQAEALAASLATMSIDACLASDLRRAVQTAEIVARPHHLDVLTTPLLRERDWGDFTGRFIPDLKDEAWPQNVETQEAMMQRGRKFLQLVAERYAGMTVLAVGHGIINKAIQSVFFNKPMREIKPMTNAEVRELRLP